LLEHLLHEFGAEPGEPVSVGNHKRELIALVNSFQYGSKSLAPVVESGGDVGDDFSVGVLLLHESDLALEVAGLLVAGDPAVADGGAVLGFAKVGLDVIPALSALGSDGRDDSGIGIPSEGVRVESKDFCGLS
jgi:hypothetical protein